MTKYIFGALFVFLLSACNIEPDKNSTRAPGEGNQGAGSGSEFYAGGSAKNSPSATTKASGSPAANKCPPELTYVGHWPRD
jgi:hypothetical protein